MKLNELRTAMLVATALILAMVVVAYSDFHDHLYWNGSIDILIIITSMAIIRFISKQIDHIEEETRQKHLQRSWRNRK